MKNLIIFCLICLLFLSCSHSSNSDEDKFTLVERITFPVDENTYYLSKSVSSFVDKQTGKEYFSFENSEKGQHEILFYDMDSQQLVKRIDIQRTGPNAIAMFGHYVKDLNHIYITSTGQQSLFLVNDKGEILKSYDYSLSDKGEPLSYVFSASYSHNPLVFYGFSIHLPQRMIHYEMSGDDWLATPICAVMDTLSGVSKILPLKYPLLFQEKSLINSSINVGYSFDFDGTNFIYSFMKSDSIIVTSDHVSSRKYAAKSRYLSKVKCIPNGGDGIEAGERSLCEQEMYWHFVYDKYRDVYYRFAFSSCDFDSKTDVMELEGIRQEFSVIVMNKDFQVIKEVRFPKNKYLPKMFFVGKKGLYISENNPYNPEFNENRLTFSCFEL